MRGDVRLSCGLEVQFEGRIVCLVGQGMRWPCPLD
jgi:hypothetical protein